jgi:hypothetical protein
MTPTDGLAAGVAETPIRRIAAGSLARVALAACVLALAALVVTSTGPGGIGGSLGSLFGFHARVAPRPGGVRAGAPSAVRALVTAPSTSRPSQPQQRRTARGRGGPRRPAPAHQPAAVPGAPPPNPSPQPIPTPTLPPTPPAEPPQGVVGGVGAAVEQAGRLLPPAQPFLDTAVGQLGQVCGLLGGCP